MNEEFKNDNVASVSKIDKSDRIYQLEKGAVVGFLVGILATAVASFSVFNGIAYVFSILILGPVDLIFQYWNGFFLLSPVWFFTYFIDYITIGVAIAFLLDKSYHFKNKLLGLIIFIIIITLLPMSLGYALNEHILSVINNANNIEVCKKFENDSYEYQSCIFQVAVNTKNEALCLVVADEGSIYRSGCFAKIGSLKNDFEVCLKARGTDDQNDCIYNVAINTKNKELCNKINVGNDAYPYSLGLSVQSKCFSNTK